MINFSSGLQIFYVSGRCRAGLYMKGKIFLDTLTKLSGARTSSFLAVSLRFFTFFPHCGAWFWATHSQPYRFLICVGLLVGFTRWLHWFHDTLRRRLIYTLRCSVNIVKTEHRTSHQGGWPTRRLSDELDPSPHPEIFTSVLVEFNPHFNLFTSATLW